MSFRKSDSDWDSTRHPKHGKHAKNPSALQDDADFSQAEDSSAYSERPTQNYGYSSQDNTPYQNYRQDSAQGYNQPYANQGYDQPYSDQTRRFSGQGSNRQQGYYQQSAGQNQGYSQGYTQQNYNYARPQTGQSYVRNAEDVFSDDVSNYAPSEYAGATTRHKHRKLKIVLIIIAIILVLLGIFAYTFYQSARAVSTSARNAVATTSTMSDELRNGNTDNLSAHAQELSQDVANMKSETNKPVWRIAEAVPYYGEDINKTMQLIDIMQGLSNDVVTPVAQQANGVSLKQLFTNGQIDVNTLSNLCNTVSAAQPALSQETDAINALGDTHIDRINTPLQTARDRLNQANSVVSDITQITPYLPAFCGSNGERNYLVIAQNNSEIRSTGGFPGSRMLMTVDNGKISLGDFAPAGLHYDRGTIPLTDEEYNVTVNIMQSNADLAPGDVNAVPSFPRAAQLMQWCWQESNGGQIDGVIAVDPVFLQSLLQLTGGVTTSNGTRVDGSNAAQVLLNQTYYLPTAEQDPFFDEVAGLALNSVLGNIGGSSTMSLLHTIRSGAQSGHLIVYMDDPSEEACINRMGMAGEVNQDPTKPQNGFYLYDRTGSKLDWYLDFRSQILQSTKNSDGSTTYSVQVTLTNTTTLDEMQELPQYITGLAPESHNYSMVTAFCIMAPAGGTISNLSINADVVNNQEEATLYGNDVWAGSIQTYPSATSTFTYDVTTSPNAQSDLTVWKTPTGRTFQ